MTTTERGSMRAVAYVMTSVAMACSSQPQPAASIRVPPALSDSVASTPLALYSYPAADTVRRGQPVRIGVLLRTANEPVTISNLPEAYTFAVIGPKGDTLRSTAGPYESGLYGEEPGLSVPRHGFVGQVVDLTCVIPHYGGHGVSKKPCMFRYQFNDAGAYTIIARFRSHGVGQNPSPVDLQSPPIHIVVK